MDKFSNHESFRNSLASAFRREVFGPIAADGKAATEETIPIAPLQLYSTGVLFPQGLEQSSLEDSPPEETTGTQAEEEVSQPMDERDPYTPGNAAGSVGEGASDFVADEPLNLANEFSPSAVGLSFRLSEAVSLVAKVSFGTYVQITETIPHPRAGKTASDGTPFPDTKDVKRFRRVHQEHPINMVVPDVACVLKPEPVPGSDHQLSLRVTVRKRPDNTLVVTAMLVNENRADKKLPPKSSEAFYQVQLEIGESNGRVVFMPIDRAAGSSFDDEMKSMDLLYRHRRAFSLGHGAAGDWNRDETLSEKGATDMVRYTVVPTHEVKPISPRKTAFDSQNDLNLSMLFLAEGDGTSNSKAAIIGALKGLCGDYERWITSIRSDAAAILGELHGTAEEHINECEKCLKRMKSGISELENNPRAMSAFRIMNRAMLIQQIHSSALKLRKYESDMPTISEGYTEYEGSERKWYPFQLAFILINIQGISNAESDERLIVDLIWFPTGGGKTEAYLGLSAFTISYERLLGRAMGSTVLMRYTLRLLTAQQFKRAAALIVALEHIRRTKWYGTDLGASEISIGLWVGRGLSPNTRVDARGSLKKLQSGYGRGSDSNPFQVLECPWCRVELDNKKKLGYVEWPRRTRRDRTVRFVCPDDACPFSEDHGGLPIKIIDEDIYERPPTLLIGTVDKFAQIAWNDSAGRIFGLGNGFSPPTLIIQDELHLISGPLGTMVGLYETAIDRLCSRDGYVHKIVASTATIRRAHEQCWELYARETFEFPPQGIRAGESYFAQEDGEAAGRLYVGYMGTAVKSHQTALVRACSPLLQGVCEPVGEDEDEKKKIVDPYGTLVWYFNSLRELGHAATLAVGDIPEHILGLCHRQEIPYANRRKMATPVELTSRRTADEIPEILKRLEIPWQMQQSGEYPVDILLATNMISVGVDVPRLGLLVMSGQPKSSSEYIQATSRVGRKFPGLVATVYTQNKSRDRSHYESFVSYHQSMYKYVEPTTVTPFSPQARDRGMRGVLIALARLRAGLVRPDQIVEKKGELQKEIDFILGRVRQLDEDELSDASDELKYWLAKWQKIKPPEYGKMGGVPQDVTLAYPFGGNWHRLYQRESWPVMTTMRNVDATCVARVLVSYDFNNEEA